MSEDDLDMVIASENADARRRDARDNPLPAPPEEFGSWIECALFACSSLPIVYGAPGVQQAQMIDVERNARAEIIRLRLRLAALEGVCRAIDDELECQTKLFFEDRGVETCRDRTRPPPDGWCAVCVAREELGKEGA